MVYCIKKAAVLGAGVMGSGIAAHLAGAGIPVCLLDMAPASLTPEEETRGMALQAPEVRNRIARLAKERVSSPRSRALYDPDLASLITVGNFADHLNLLQECDWIIEAVVENPGVKESLLLAAAKHRKPGAIVSTNTSGVSINALAEKLPDEMRQHFLGTHFFNPPRYMKLLEIIPARDCLPEVAEFMADFLTKRLGKGVVFAKDTPAFIANRIGSYSSLLVLQMAGKSSFNLLEIDRITGPVLGRPKTGTFRTFDLVGLDTVANVSAYLMKTLRNTQELEVIRSAELLRPLTAKGFLGDKTKQGFYRKIKTGTDTQTYVWDFAKEDYVEAPTVTTPGTDAALKERDLPQKLRALLYGSAEDSVFAWNLVKRLLLFTAGLVPEISNDYKEIDKAIVWGFNWEAGPFQIWDAIGLEESVRRMESEGEIIPDWVKQRMAAGLQRFYFGSADTPYIRLGSSKYPVVMKNPDASLLEIGDDVVCLQFTSKNNTMTDKITDLLENTLQALEKNYLGLVIANQSKNFSPGVDLGLVGGFIADRNWTELERVIARGQLIHQRLKYFGKPVVTAPYGMTLGAGAEIVLHSHGISAHAETYIGLVEAGAGVVPSSGGCKELLLRRMAPLSGMQGADIMPAVKKAWETIVMCKVSGSAHEAMKMGFLRKSDSIVMGQDYLVDQAKDAVLYISENGFRPFQKKDIIVAGTTGRAALEMVTYNMVEGGFSSAYDGLIANRIAHILCGGSVPYGTLVPEEQILDLEREAFLSLCGEEKTQQRIAHFIKTGKLLKN